MTYTLGRFYRPRNRKKCDGDPCFLKKVLYNYVEKGGNVVVLVAPSLLSADFACLGKELKAVTKAGADMIHIDVMDGHFVPNLTFGPCVVQGIRPCTDLPFDVHLMMTNPGEFIDAFAKAGADSITVHLEAGESVPDLISKIKKVGCGVGLSIRPGTNISALIPYLPDIDSVLVFAVEPGFGGQRFQKQAIARIAALKELIGRKPVRISVDGGINDVTAPACVVAGADVLVAGSYVFGAKSYMKAIQTLKEGMR